MKLSVVRGGGLGGFVTHTEIAEEALSAEGAKALRDKVAEARLLKLPPAPAPEKAYPEDLHYELTVEDEGRRRTVRMTEASMPDSVRSLIAWADSVPERKERVEPPGKSGGQS
jgi:hypothetical protein